MNIHYNNVLNYVLFIELHHNRSGKTNVYFVKKSKKLFHIAIALNLCLFSISYLSQAAINNIFMHNLSFILCFN